MTMAHEPAATADGSNGWEAIAGKQILLGRQSRVGVQVIEAWAMRLPASARVLDLGCGGGGPRSAALAQPGFSVHAIDASPTMASAYRTQIPGARVACEAAERSEFFGESFHGVLAWGLLFLLEPTTQRTLLRRIAQALVPGGSVLFTAPTQAGTWRDLSTGRLSVSLGRTGYLDALNAAGLSLRAEADDDGQNHSYEAVKL